MRLNRLVILSSLLLAFLTACSSQSGGREAVAAASLPAAPLVNNAAQAPAPDGETKQDEQGQVTVSITPLNLSSHDDTLEFDVAMNTHSVDLSMDLAALATLQTDTGLTVEAITWDATRGGHHVSGLLHFPTELDGRHILDDATTLTLTLQNVDVPTRVFTWQIAR